MFKFIAKFGSNDSGNGKFNSPFLVTTDNKAIFMQAIVIIIEFGYLTPMGNG
jgi:hypothetical protein